MTEIEQLIDYVSSNGRVCPNVTEWMQVSEIIGANQGGHKCCPLILAGWSFSSDMDKRQRVISQIKYSLTLGDEIFHKFSKSLYALKNDQWYCSPDTPLSTWQWDGT